MGQFLFLCCSQRIALRFTRGYSPALLRGGWCCWVVIGVVLVLELEFGLWEFAGFILRRSAAR